MERPAFARWLKGWRAGWKTSPEFSEHMKMGARGEREAYEYLRRRGYRILARNYRRPGVKGEIDLVGWDRDTLVFVEVKTRQSREVRAAEDAVDASKRRSLIRMARVFRRHARLTAAPYRFDVVSVYAGQVGESRVEHFPEAFRESGARS